MSCVRLLPLCFKRGKRKPPTSLPLSGTQGVDAVDEDSTEALELVSHNTWWAALVEVFRAAKEAAFPLPPLQAALGGLVAAMEVINNVGDARSGFAHLVKECEGIQGILRQYNSILRSSSSLESRLDAFSRALAVVTKMVENKGDRGVARRVIEARGDVAEIRALFTHLSLLISKLQLDLNIDTQQNVENLAVEDKLAKLHAVGDASINSQESKLACLPGTRLELLGSILAWAHDPDAKSIFWLNGMAGTGKSAIARTFCQQLQEVGLLGSSFFCSRRDTDRSNAQRILPTIAYFLAREDSEYRDSLVLAIQAFPDVATATVDRQFQCLFSTPFEKLQRNGNIEIPRLIIVIDAVDECFNSDTVYHVLKLLMARAEQLPLKFFITGRPEAHVRRMFEGSSAHVLRLRDIQKSTVEADIELFLRARLQDIRESHSYLEQSWPGDAAIQRLKARSADLFIFASTVCKFLERDPRKRLLMVTKSSLHTENEKPLTKDLDDMYSLILNQAKDPDELLTSEAELLTEVVSHVILLRQPPSVAALSAILQHPAEKVRTTLEELHAVLSVPDSNEDGSILTLHASFADYLTDPIRSAGHFLDRGDVHFHVADECLRILESDQLHFNVGQCKSSYLSNDQIHAALSPELVYAARNFPYHVAAASANSRVLYDRIQSVFYEKFLYWLEVLSLSGHAREASSLVLFLSKTLKKDVDSNFMDFLQDANGFIIQSIDILLRSAPHIYLSALPMSMGTSRVYTEYRAKVPRTLKITTSGVARFRPSLLHLVGHTSLVYAVAFSPDGARIVSGSKDKTIIVWDATTGEAVLPPLEGHTDTVYSVAFSPDGTRIASGSSDKTIRFWDATTGEAVIPPLEGHTGSVFSVAFSPDGTRIVSGSSDNTIRVWNATTGEPAPLPLKGHTELVHSVAFSPDGVRIVSGSYDNTIRVWDATTGEALLSPLEGHTSWVFSVAFSPDGAHIVSGSRDNTIRVWDATTGEPALPPLKGHTYWVFSVAFSPDGARIVSSSRDNTIRVWDAMTGEAALPAFKGHTNTVYSAVFSPDGAHIVSGSYDHTIRVWDATMGGVALLPLEGHTSRVSSVAFSPDGTRIVSGSKDSTIRVWGATTGEAVLPPLEGHTDSVHSVAFSPDGMRIVSGSYDKTIRVWDATTGEAALPPIKGHKSWVSSVAFSPDGGRIVSSSYDKTIRVWDATTGKPTLPPLRGHTDWAFSAAFSPDGARVVSGSRGNTIRVWDATTGEPALPPLEGHTSSIHSVAFSPDGGRIVSGSYDKTIRVWNATTGEPALPPLEGHTKCVSSVAFSPDGMRIVSGSYDNTIRVWDATTGEAAHPPLEGHMDSIHSVAFSPDGARIVSGSEDNTIRVSNGTTSKILHSALTLPVGVASVPLYRSPHLYPASPTLVNALDSADSLRLERGENGYWITGPSSELLFWVPREFVDTLYWPKTIFVIATSKVYVDWSKFVYGEDWIRCCDPLPAEIISVMEQ